MTKEDKELLLMDLCARLPYKVKIRINSKPKVLLGVGDGSVIVRERDKHGYNWAVCDVDEWNAKPYLRPMSSMTEYEKNEIKTLNRISSNKWPCRFDITDYYNAHHFDYRGLIEKGLAIEAPKDLYKTK